MADKQTDIFKGLKSYSIIPPANLFKKIWAVLMQKNSSAASISLSKPLTPNEENYNNTEIEIFRSLQGYTIPSPDFSTLRIGEISKTIDAPAKTFAKIISFKYLTRIAVAILIICFGVWAAYTKSHKKNDAPVAIVAPANVLPANNNTINKLITDSNNKKLKTVAVKNNLVARTDKTNAINADGLKTHTIKPRTQLINNDVLLTLVSYHYNNYQPLLAEIKKNDKITLDKFSYVTISDKMNSILKQMYSTNRKNKPTHQAKKLKSKLDKWKKSDVKHFDTNAANNPVDIIDLSEFILK